MFSFTDFSALVQEVGAEVYQEVFALALFVASFLLFKYLNGKRVPKAQPKVLNHTASAVPLKRSSAGSCQQIEQRQLREAQVQEAEKQMKALLERREFTAALSAYRTFERQGMDRFFTNEALYGCFIESAVRVGKLDVVERMLKMMLRNHIVPSVTFWHRVLKMLSSRKHYAACLQVYLSHGQVLPDDKVIFSCLINAAIEGGMADKALSMFSRYQECNLEASDYVTLFRVCAATASTQVAESLFLEMKAKTTPLMLNLVLLSCVNAKDAKLAMDLLLKAHQFEAVDEAPASSKVQIVDTISYNTVIKGFVASRNLEGCSQCLESMRIHNLETDDVTLTSLLDISLTDATCGVTNRLVEMLLEKGQGRPLDAMTCNLFIKGLIRAEHLPKAVQVYNALNKSGGSPSIMTYSMMIKALVDALELDRAFLIVADMQSAGVAPDEMIFTHLLEGCRLQCKLELGERLFENMIVAGVQPSEYTLTIMVKLYGRCGAHEKAHCLVESWESKHRMKPSVIHFTCLMSGCLRSKAYEQAWAAYQLMEKNGVAPDQVMMATLLPAMAASKCFDRVLQLARRALQRPGGIKMPGATLNNALAQMMSAPGAAQDAKEMRSLMEAAGVAVSGRATMLW